MSRDNPRSERWAAYYELHPNIVASYNEVSGGSPPHEPLCPEDTSRPTKASESLFPDEPLPVADPNAFCWCNAFCGFCDHHMDHHNYAHGAGIVPCIQCPDQICPRDRKDRAR